MNNYPSPPIFLHRSLDEHGRPTYHVVDGKQRLQTIIDFTRNKIYLPDDFSDAALQKKRWKDLGREDREKFWNYVIVVEMLPDVTDTFVRNVFDRINRNARKLARQELRHAKYDGWFISTAEAEANKEEWRSFGVVTTARAKRMTDVQFISELMTIVIKGAIQGFDQDGLDDLYAEYDDLADQPIFVEDDFRTTLEDAKQYTRRLLELDADLLDYLKVQSHFYTLWGHIILEETRHLTPDQMAPLYKRFLLAVNDLLEDPLSEKLLADARTDQDELQAAMPAPGLDEYQRAVIRYAANIRGASTDLTPRQARHAALIAVTSDPEVAVDEGQ